jgi:hypothetical protein
VTYYGLMLWPFVRICQIAQPFVVALKDTPDKVNISREIIIRFLLLLWRHRIGTEVMIFVILHSA